MTKHNAYRDGMVHVMAAQCETCIFRPGNKMHLASGRRDSMAADAVKDESAIICHSTLDSDNAVCRGFFDKHPTAPLQIAQRLCLIKYVKQEDKQ